ncbi:cation transporter [Aerococcaceae bacterium DSM 111022]|nr:cation transporter [Aerococcaceae bacterium DSM 111022]
MNEVNSSHKWLLEGIDCANCAAKIENGLSEIDGVMNSNVNYMTQTLSGSIIFGVDGCSNIH